VDDAQLLASARNGSESAFQELYDRHRAPLFRFAWRLTGSVATAEDVTQECFLALLNGAAFDAAHASLRTYLFGMTRHLVRKRLRLAGRQSDEPADMTAAQDPLSHLLAEERSVLVARAVSALPPLQKEALILFEYEDLSLNDIAAITGADVGAVKARLHRARESLRRRLAPLLGLCAERSCS